MSIIEHDYDYDHNYQRYLDWKDEREKLEKEMEAYDRELDLLREQENVERLAAEYVSEEEVRKALSDIPEEDEEDVQQVAQITVGGVYRYEVEWLPETHEIRVETDHYRDGSPMYSWYPDTIGTLDVLTQLLGVASETIRIGGMTFFTQEGDVHEAFEDDLCQFTKAAWIDYVKEGLSMQFNITFSCPNKCYDAACDGTGCELNSRVHGIDGTQCDCYSCERAVEERWMPEE